MKFTEPPYLPSWNTMRIGHAVLAVLAAVVAAVSGPTWPAVMMGFIVGFCIASFIGISQYMRLRGHFEQMMEITERMMVINGDLMDRRVETTVHPPSVH